PSRALEPRAEQGKLSDPVFSADAPERLGVDRQATVHRHLPTLLLRDLWWAPWESNPAPTDYESAALTRHELEARGSDDTRTKRPGVSIAAAPNPLQTALPVSLRPSAVAHSTTPRA